MDFTSFCQVVLCGGSTGLISGRGVGSADWRCSGMGKGSGG